ncbi:MAG: carboxypeptidase-like regulatory domain-containing protein, partial [Acidobacteriota bacterium]
GTDGSFVATLAAGSNDTLSLAARDAAGNTGAAVQIAVPGGLPPDPATVAPPLDPTVPTDLYAATSFLYTGADPIQTGVAPGTIEPRRVCVLRGRVLGRDGQPIPGVTITVHGHPEYGQTLSRADGRYDLAVNGGGPLTVSYAKSGHPSAVRHADVDWREWLTVDDIVLVPFDPAVSVVDLTQPVVQVARGSVVTDASGTRQATLLFNPGTTATMVLPDGTQQALTTLHVRATEYTVGPNGPRAMPAPLPANVAYTYCVELSADEEIASGSNRIDFSQPLIQYVENFLGLPVGASVPLGWFDRTKGVWLPADNGQIVQILSVNAGMADLDLDGSGVAASAPALAALGITDGERQQLAVLYQPGQSLWRVAIPHFMAPWDVNWPFSMPDGATTFGKARTSGNPDSCTACGSVVKIQAQTLGESVPLAGTPFSLSYRSSRAPGWRGETSIEVELSPSTVPATLKRIELELAVAGRHYAQTFTNAPNQRTTLHWDGNDAYGRAMSAGETAVVEVGYVYDGVYQRNYRFGYSGNGIPITGSFTRQEVTLWTRIHLP